MEFPILARLPPGTDERETAMPFSGSQGDGLEETLQLSVETPDQQRPVQQFVSLLAARLRQQDAAMAGG